MRRGSLVWRLYLLGVVQLALVAAAALWVVVRSAPPRPPRDPEHEVALAAARLKPLVSHPTELATEVDELLGHGMAGSVYDGERRLVASNVTPPLPPVPVDLRPRDPFEHDRDPFGPPPFPDDFATDGPPPRDPAVAPPSSPDGPPGNAPPWINRGGPGFAHHHGPPDRLRVVSLGDGASPSPPILVARFVPVPRDLRGLAFTLAFGVLLVGVGAALTGRWIVAPLKQLTLAARSLGEGDLRARARLTRTDEVGEMSRTFDEMAERIERLVRAEKELLANVSHELRTPLARIRVALDLAQEGDARAARESLEEIEVDLTELEALLEDVLTAARMELEGGKASPSAFALHLEDTEAPVLVERALDRFRSRHPDRAIEVAAAAELPKVRVDPVLLRRVLDNLLENAHKYTPDPSLAIDLEARASGDGVGFVVRDHGLGIPPEDLPHVFAPFFRGERSRSRGTGGVGLGLTLAKRIVEAHGGTITIASSVGVGTEVQVELPRASA
jgi:two-component system OmpR family sensor kinase